MVATTTDESDEPIVSLGKQLGVPVFRGSQEDVLERFYGAATSADADIIIRITGDCPLIDPHLIDEVVQTLLAEDVDFVSVNSIVRDFPRGVDTEGLTIDALARAEREATGSHHREHVTLYLIANLDRFKYIPIRAEGPLQRSDLRMCIDEEADLLLARAIFDHFAVIKPHFSTLDVVNLLDGNPEIRALNEHVRQPNPPDAVLPVHLLPQETES